MTDTDTGCYRCEGDVDANNQRPVVRIKEGFIPTQLQTVAQETASQ